MSVVSHARPATVSTEWRSDLSWVACQAATEIDNLLLGKNVAINAVKGLGSKISDSVKSSASTPFASLVDPTTTVVLTHALRETNPKLSNMADLVELATGIVSQLKQLSETTVKRTTEEEKALKALREFCLAVSRHSTAVTPFSSNRPEHPFRR